MDFLELVFNEAINMTKIGSVLFLIILIARYMLSRFPKIYSYLLWIALFVRLLIPMNLSVSMGLIVLRNFKKKHKHEYTSKYIGWSSKGIQFI